MKACADGNPEHNEGVSEADQAKGNATPSRETHEDDQGDSDFTALFDNALYCAIVPCRDDPVVSPPDIEDTASCLHKVECEK